MKSLSQIFIFGFLLFMAHGVEAMDYSSLGKDVYLGPEYEQFLKDLRHFEGRTEASEVSETPSVTRRGETPPMSRIIATPAEPDFLLDCFFNLKCARPMPTYAVPASLTSL